MYSFSIKCKWFLGPFAHSQLYSLCWMFSAVSVRLFVCVCVCVCFFVNTITSECVYIGWWNLGVGSLFKKISTEFEFGVIATLKNVALGYDVGKISASCLVFSFNCYLTQFVYYITFRKCMKLSTLIRIFVKEAMLEKCYCQMWQCYEWIVKYVRLYTGSQKTTLM